MAGFADLARPLRDPADRDPLLERIGDVRVVAVGEASHGTHEYYAADEIGDLARLTAPDRARSPISAGRASRRALGCCEHPPVVRRILER